MNRYKLKILETPEIDFDETELLSRMDENDFAKSEKVTTEEFKADNMIKALVKAHSHISRYLAIAGNIEVTERKKKRIVYEELRSTNRSLVETGKSVEAKVYFRLYQYSDVKINPKQRTLYNPEKDGVIS